MEMGIMTFGKEKNWIGYVEKIEVTEEMRKHGMDTWRCTAIQ